MQNKHNHVIYWGTQWLLKWKVYWLLVFAEKFFCDGIIALCCRCSVNIETCKTTTQCDVPALHQVNSECIKWLRSSTKYLQNITTAWRWLVNLKLLLCLRFSWNLWLLIDPIDHWLEQNYPPTELIFGHRNKSLVFDSCPSCWSKWFLSCSLQTINYTLCCRFSVRV